MTAVGPYGVPVGSGVSVTVNAPAAQITWSGPAPTVERRALPPAGATTWSAPAPGVVISLSPPAGQVTFSAPVPDPFRIPPDELFVRLDNSYVFVLVDA